MYIEVLSRLVSSLLQRGGLQWGLIYVAPPPTSDHILCNWPPGRRRQHKKRKVHSETCARNLLSCQFSANHQAFKAQREKLCVREGRSVEPDPRQSHAPHGYNEAIMKKNKPQQLVYYRMDSETTAHHGYYGHDRSCSKTGIRLSGVATFSGAWPQVKNPTQRSRCARLNRQQPYFARRAIYGGQNIDHCDRQQVHHITRTDQHHRRSMNLAPGTTPLSTTRSTFFDGEESTPAVSYSMHRTELAATKQHHVCGN